MIYDKIENIELYCMKNSKLFKAVKYVIDFDLSRPDGEYEVEGKEIFAKVQSYRTQEAEKQTFEAHRKYYDIQVMKLGRERQDIYVGNESELEHLEEYNFENDAIKLKPPKFFSSIIISPGEFTIYCPHDIHRPNCCVNSPDEVRKICMKVKL